MPAATIAPFIEKITARIVGDPDADTSYLEQAEFADRLDEYRRDVFSFVGVVTEATVRVQTAQGGFGPAHTIRGGSLWGIENDSQSSYFREVARDCMKELENELHALGIDISAPEVQAMMDKAADDVI
jgi:hypothetical protein